MEGRQATGSKLNLRPPSGSKIQSNQKSYQPPANRSQSQKRMRPSSSGSGHRVIKMIAENEGNKTDLASSVYFTDEVKIRIENENKFVNEFKVLANIGQGSYSKVKKVLREDDDEQKFYAMKMMHKPILSQQRAVRYSANGEMEIINNLDKVYNEVEIWAQVSHPNITKIFEIIDAEEHDYLYIILELADLGQLAKWDFEKEIYIRNQKIIDSVLGFLQQNEGMDPEQVSDQEKLEAVARFLFVQLAQALIYLHEEAGIIHRDIKLDNILFDSKHCQVKLSDFTVSRGEITNETKLFDCEGTPSFTAPECTVVEKDGYEPKPTDIWSFGVCLYTFISGIVPFYGDCELQIQINTRREELQVPEQFSPSLKDLLHHLLNKDPKKRPTTVQLLQHPWFIGQRFYEELGVSDQNEVNDN